MSIKIVTYFIYMLIAAAIILFSLSLSYLLTIMFFSVQVTSGEINSALVTMFVSGVVTSLSVSVKNMLNKTKSLKDYILLAKVTSILVVVMITIRYMIMAA